MLKAFDLLGEGGGVQMLRFTLRQHRVHTVGPCHRDARRNGNAFVHALNVSRGCASQQCLRIRLPVANGMRGRPSLGGLAACRWHSQCPARQSPVRCKPPSETLDSRNHWRRSYGAASILR